MYVLHELIDKQLYPTELSGIPPETVDRLIPEHARKQNHFMALHS